MKKSELVKSTGRNTGNLKPAWKPGQSGNPKGRPRKEFCLSDVLRKIGETKNSTAEITRFEELCRVIWNRALNGDMAAINLIFDRIEGKVKPATSPGEEGIVDLTEFAKVIKNAYTVQTDV